MINYYILRQGRYGPFFAIRRWIPFEEYLRNDMEFYNNSPTFSSNILGMVKLLFSSTRGNLLNIAPSLEDFENGCILKFSEV